MVKPDHLITVFAGDKDVDAARQHMFPFSIIAMYGFVQKRRIGSYVRTSSQGRPAEMIAENLQDAFNEYC
jgi:putative YphP/YqiW family bacilliredoxin